MVHSVYLDAMGDHRVGSARLAWRRDESRSDRRRPTGKSERFEACTRRTRLKSGSRRLSRLSCPASCGGIRISRAPIGAAGSRWAPVTSPTSATRTGSMYVERHAQRLPPGRRRVSRAPPVRSPRVVVGNRRLAQGHGGWATTAWAPPTPRRTIARSTASHSHTSRAPWTSGPGAIGWCSAAARTTRSGVQARRSGSSPSIEEVYTPETAPGLGATPTYLHVFGSVAADSRRAPGYARRGGYYACLPPWLRRQRQPLQLPPPGLRSHPARAARPRSVGALRSAARWRRPTPPTAHGCRTS